MFSARFASTTLKLTGWYLLIIMVISVVFSLLVYQTATGEVRARLEQFGDRLPRDAFVLGFDRTSRIDDLRRGQAMEAGHNILTNLLYVNLIVFLTGGVASYLMAKRTLQPLEEAHANEARFVGDASHELRTPLAAMKTELEVALQDPKLSKQEMVELLKSNLEEVNQLSALSQTLLTLSKMEYDQLDYKSVNFGEIVKKTIDKYNTQKRIEYVGDSKELLIRGNEPSIEELVTVLVDNALKYSPLDTTIRAKLFKQNGKATFTIVNSGKGISAENLPHIFDRFYRADSARSKNKETSFGLGLSLAKQIVDLHDGELTASSALDHDTTFTVSLPIQRKTSAKNQ